MVAPVALPGDLGREQLAAELDRLLEVADRGAVVVAGEGDQAEIVVALGVAIEAIDEQLEDRGRRLVVVAIVQIRSLLLDLGRDVATPTAQRELPAELVIGGPLVLLAIAELQAPLDEISEERELAAMGAALERDGMPESCALNFDHVTLVQRSRLGAVICARRECNAAWAGRWRAA
ncbi:MAG TPA: hypothetical protein VK601_11425 [Kofleriaceae bacterium]|nr:hypothetical protein [Kofleriaceae bacterium]